MNQIWMFQRVTVCLNSGVRMCKGDYTGPLISVDISSFDIFDEFRNKTYAPPIMDFINKELNIEDKR